MCQTDQDTYAVFDGFNTLSPQKLEACGGSGKQWSYFTLNILYLVMTFRVVVNGAQKGSTSFRLRLTRILQVEA